MKITTSHTSNSPVTFVTHTHFAVLLFLAVLLRKLTIIAIWTQCNMIGSMQPWGVIQKSHSNTETVQKVLQSVAEFVPTRVNEVLVLISLESRCFAWFRTGEHDVSKTSTLESISSLFPGIFCVLHQTIHLIPKCGLYNCLLFMLIGSIFAKLYLETRHWGVNIMKTRNDLICHHFAI